MAEEVLHLELHQRLRHELLLQQRRQQVSRLFSPSRLKYLLQLRQELLVSWDKWLLPLVVLLLDPSSATVSQM